MEPGRDDTGELRPPEIESPPAYVRLEPRYFGLTPHLLAGVLAAAGIAAGIGLLAA